MAAAPTTQEGYCSLFKRIIIGIIGIGILGLFGFLVLAWRPAIAPIDAPAPGSFPAELVA
jgi:hypothetical protein